MKALLTIGDPAGIGPEITRKIISSGSIPGDFELTVICDKDFKSQIKKIPGNIKLEQIDNTIKYKEGNPSVETAKQSYLYLEKAIRILKKSPGKEYKLLITCPISKEWWIKANINYSGHTELLAAAFGVKDVGMVFVSNLLKVLTVTRHIPVKNISKNLTEEKILNALFIAKKTLDLFNIKNGKICVLGLNPHCGDGGLIGDEEIKVIIPAIKKAEKAGLNIAGPFSTDKGFYDTLSMKYEIIVAMYHDQAILPLKILSNKKAYNLTVGLPFLRVSPLHGTAFDIAGKNLASCESLLFSILESKNLVKCI